MGPLGARPTFRFRAALHDLELVVVCAMRRGGGDMWKEFKGLEHPRALTMQLRCPIFFLSSPNIGSTMRCWVQLRRCFPPTQRYVFPCFAIAVLRMLLQVSQLRKRVVGGLIAVDKHFVRQSTIVHFGCLSVVLHSRRHCTSVFGRRQQVTLSCVPCR